MISCVEVVGNGKDHIIIGELKFFIYGRGVGQLASQARVEENFYSLACVPLIHMQFNI